MLQHQTKSEDNREWLEIKGFTKQWAKRKGFPST